MINSAPTMIVAPSVPHNVTAMRHSGDNFFNVSWKINKNSVQDAFRIHVCQVADPEVCIQPITLNKVKGALPTSYKLSVIGTRAAGLNNVAITAVSFGEESEKSIPDTIVFGERAFLNIALQVATYIHTYFTNGKVCHHI